MENKAELVFKVVSSIDCAESRSEELNICLQVSLHPFAEIRVQRSRSQVQALISDLQAFVQVCADPCSAPKIEVPALTETISDVEIESTINNLLEEPAIVKEPWNCAALVNFLDNAPTPICLNSSVFLLMKQKIMSLDYSNSQANQLVVDLQAKYAELAQQVQSIQRMMQIQHQEHTTTSATAAATTLDPAHLLPCTATSSPSSNSSSSSVLMKNLPPLELTVFSSATLASDSAGASAGVAEIRNSNEVSPLANTAARFNPSAPEFNPLTGIAETAVPCVPASQPGELPSSPVLTSDSYAAAQQVECFSEVVAELIHGLCPHQAQLQYRDSVVALLQRNFRVALNCEALEVGLHRILCFLPDDPIKVSAVLCRNHSTKWHRIICDRLNLIAKRKAEEMAGEGYTYRNDRPDESGGDDSTGDHIIRNVLISNSKLSIQVLCNIDNCEVELSCNSRADICMLALLEEFSALVGKNDLFKQTLMLVRAWWSYECAAYVGTSIKYYLSDYALCVMVCAIFNQHHARLHTPLQALAAFLAEYSTYDGATSAITIMGIVPFKSTTSNHPVLPPAFNAMMGFSSPASSAGSTQPVEYLLTSEIMERYWLLFCPPDPSNPEQQQQPKILPSLSCSSEDVQGVDLNGIMNTNFSLEFNHSTGNTSAAGDSGRASATSDGFGSAPTLEETALSAHRQACTRNLAKFDRSNFNIIDPFNCTNMLLERPSQNRILRLTKVFQTGAAQMATMLTAATKETAEAQAQQKASATHVRGLLKALFPVSTARFVESIARPDTFNVDLAYVPPAIYAQLTRKIPMKVSLEELARQMRYCNLMEESVISRSAVLDLVVEILTQKGPLPIGEVGKALAELTCITGLSSRLKEAYGGLKKFLEDFSSVVIIGTDHPFNPHIVMRSSLSPENLALNDSGMFPTHIVLRMKKVTATSLRKGAYVGKPTPQPMNQQGMSQYQPQYQSQQQGYRPSMPNANPGIGMGGMGMDNRGGSMGMSLPARPPTYSPPPPAHYGQQKPQQQQLQQQGSYNAKILSGLHADAQRELTYGRAPPPPQRHNSLDRHSSGSTNSNSQGTLNGSGTTHGNSFSNPYNLSDVGNSFSSSNSNDPFDDFLGSSVQPSPSASYHKLPFSGSQSSQSSLQVQAPPPQSDHYHQQQQQQQRGYQSPQDYSPAGAYEVQRGRLDSHDQQRRALPPYQHASALGSARGIMPPQQLQDPHRGDFGQGQGSRPNSGTYGQPSPRSDFSPSPSGSQNSYVVDSFFESSAAPLPADPYAHNRQHTAVRAGSFTSSAGVGLGAAGSSNGIGSGRDDGLSGARNRVGSLLSGLREGTVELNEHGHQVLQQAQQLGQGQQQGQGHSLQHQQLGQQPPQQLSQQGREWGASFPAASQQPDYFGGGADWRGQQLQQQQGHQDRQY